MKRNDAGYWLDLCEPEAAWKLEVGDDPTTPRVVQTLLTGAGRQPVTPLQLTAILDWDWSVARRTGSRPGLDYCPRGL